MQTEGRAYLEAWRGERAAVDATTGDPRQAQQIVAHGSVVQPAAYVCK